MQKQIQKKTACLSIPKMFLFVTLSLLLVQCKKNGDTVTPENVPESKTNANAINEKLTSLTKEIAFLAKTRQFKQLVYDECKTQKYGDYYVRIEDLLSRADVDRYISATKQASISKILTDLKKLDARNPIIFYPAVETKEDNKLTTPNSRIADDDDPIYVIDSVVQYYTNDEYPGYYFGTDGELDYAMQITELFAWNNDVWVVGEEENCSEGNMEDAPEDLELNDSSSRVNGESENGGIIQVTNLGNLEPWINGKLEFRYVINNASGTIIKDRAFGKVKRKYFKDNKVYDFNDFIANWNTANIGNWMIEGWIEEDGGNSTNTISQTFAAPCTGCPSTTISYTKQNKDFDMGRTMIQFSDSKSQWYNITYANVKRR
jgi:hypothetical protein